MNQVSAGTDVDTGVGGLHAREVELRAWGGERLVQVQLNEPPSRTGTGLTHGTEQAVDA